MGTLTSRVGANQTSTWRRVDLSGAPFYIHRLIIADDGVVIYRAFKPVSTENAHMNVHHHPEFGLLGQLGSEPLPEPLLASARTRVKPDERLRQIEEFREPFRLLAQAVIIAGVPELQGFRLHPTQPHIEIILN